MRNNIFMLALVLALCLPSSAQTDRATITGAITDSSGASVPGANVVIVHSATGAKYQTISTQAGYYTQPGLPSGTYELTIDAPGFKKLVRRGITLQVSDILRVDGKLEVGSISDSVQVAAETARLQTDSPEVSATLDNKSLLDLPLSFSGGRHADNFAFSIMPGVQGTSYTSHINGSTEFSKEVLLEGASSTANQTGDGVASYVSIEALQEVKIQTSGLSAEYGRTQGGVFNFVMKSGTNELHGSAFGALRNEDLNANTFANKARGIPRAIDRKKNYAFSAGGPVWIPKIYNGRNKTFFYAAYEHYSDTTWSLGSPNKTVPIPDFYQGDFSRLLGPNVGTDALGRSVARGAIFDPTTFRQVTPGGRYVGDMFPGNKIPLSRFSAVSKNLNNILSKYYLPTVKDASGLVPLTNNASFPISGQPIWDHNLWSIKADQLVGSNHRLSGSFNYARTPRLILDSGGLWSITAPDPGGPLAKVRYRGDTGEAARISEDWTISPRMLNHAQIFYNRRGNPQIGAQVGVDGAQELGLKNLSTKGYPVVNWNGGPIYNLTEGPGFIYDSFRADVMFGFNDTLSFSKGRHFIKVGFDTRRNHQNTSPGTSPSFTFNALETAIPNETFSGTQTGYVFASYLLGTVHNAGQTEATNLGGRRNYYAAFVQDDFKVGSRLTLNLGLRWDFQQPVYEVANRYSSWDPNVIDPASGLKGAYTFAGSCNICTGRNYFGKRDYKDFGPRIGFAWRPAEKWTVRGAYGIVYDADSFNGYSGTPLGKPTNTAWGGTYSLSANTINPWAGIFNWDNGFPTDRYAPAGFDLSWGDRNRPGQVDPRYGMSPYVQQWNFNIQRELVKKLVLDVGYSGMKATGLKNDSLVAINQIPASALQQYGTKLNNTIRSAADAAALGVAYPYPGFQGSLAAALRPYPQVNGNSTIQTYGTPIGFSTYNALQVSLNRQFSRSFSLFANYVYSKTLSNVDSELIGGNGANNAPQDYYNLKNEKSIAGYDIPHAFKAYANFELPVGRGKALLGSAPRLVNAVVGGWAISGIVNYFSGTPLGPFTAPTPLSSGWNGGNNRPNVSAGDLMNANFDRSNFELSSTSSPSNTYLNKAMFSAPAALALGGGAKRYSSVRGFPTMNEDLALAKTNHITEKVRLSIRAEFLNALNRHQLGGISASFSNANFGQVTSVSGNRQMQVSARLDF
jgi:hypothetical protein